MLKRPDVIYTYDGSFEGFLCCVFESFEHREIPADIKPDYEQQLSLYPSRYIETNQKKADRVYHSIPQKISKDAALFVLNSFFSCLEGKELHILNLLRMGYRAGGKILDMLTNETVDVLTKAVQYLGNEVHRYKEFIRFSEHSSVLVAKIEPKCYVLPLLEHHFCDRYSGEHFMIFDETHHAALVYRPFESKIIPMDAITLPKPNQKEHEYRDLWQTFYDTIAIESRKNHRCRMSFMPKRYWPHMTEFNNLPQRGRPAVRIQERKYLKQAGE